MSGRSMSMVVVVAATTVMLVQVIMAKTLTVGDDSGWGVPSSPDFYSSWAANQSFAVGDILEFKFPNAIHTVAQVTSKESYETCDDKLDQNAKVFDSTTEVTLIEEGTYYFFCSVGRHCAGGQKLSITVPSTALPRAIFTNSASRRQFSHVPRQFCSLHFSLSSFIHCRDYNPGGISHSDYLKEFFHFFPLVLFLMTVTL
ncbi:hypothetical protein RND81_07G109700 [Saponaria officinalis]|uniref:Phytocyanin domain-containing protein n=1 Tax=Saponaria officinalis TaxID=3572 RepID=A0AAW1JM39_SAPOF